VPYYRDLFARNRILVDGKVDLERFRETPPLTKEDIRQNYDRLTSLDPGYRRRGPFINSSGGSTGEPVRLTQDDVVWTRDMAAKWLYYSFVSEFPCRFVDLWGSERDILSGGSGLSGRVKNWLYDRTFLNTFRMSQTDMQRYVDIMNDRRPEFVEAYVQSADEVARFVLQRGLRLHTPKGVIATAGTLYPRMEESIRRAFGCPVYNRYGSREVGDMAGACGEGRGLHLNCFNHALEILDKNLVNVVPGECGEVYVTTLHNYSMPLIRFRIGDLAERAIAGQELCPCGRGMPLIRSVRGRDVNIFRTRSGDRVDGEYFTHLFYGRPWCKKFRVIQKAYERIEVLIVLNADGQQAFTTDQGVLLRDIQVVMGVGCSVSFLVVDDLAPTPSGKFLYTISEVT